jgi:hypothetical protein
MDFRSYMLVRLLEGRNQKGGSFFKAIELDMAQICPEKRTCCHSAALPREDHPPVPMSLDGSQGWQLSQSMEVS